jgi:predicted Rossmann-fold nucleotide-binding protein
MRPYWIRPLAVLLVTSLLAQETPALGQPVNHLLSNCPGAPSLFQQQALAEQLLSAHQSLGAFLRPRKWLASTGLFLLAAAGTWHFAPHMYKQWAAQLSLFNALMVYSLLDHADVKNNPNLQRIVAELRRIDRFRKKHPRAIAVFGSARFTPDDAVYQLAEKLGEEIYQAGYPARTGAGPAIMEAVLKGYKRARKAAQQHFTHQTQTQGSRIMLDFEQETNRFVETNHTVDHFMPRKLGLYRNALGAIAFPGGYGTFDEMFEVWQRGIPLVLMEPAEGPFKSFWTDKIQIFEESWAEAGLQGRIPPRPFITSSPIAAIRYLNKASRKHWEGKRISFNKMVRETIHGFIATAVWKDAITFTGRPQEGSPEWEAAGRHMNNLLNSGKTVRIVNRGTLITAAQAFVKDPELFKQIQLALFIPPGEDLRPEEKAFTCKVIAHDPSIHQIFVTKRSRALVVSPGGVGTFNRLFDNLQVIQVNKIRPIPIYLNGARFWTPILSHVIDPLLATSPKLISPGDERHFHILNGDSAQIIPFENPGERGEGTLVAILHSLLMVLGFLVGPIQPVIGMALILTALAWLVQPSLNGKQLILKAA